MTVKTIGAELKRFYADSEFWPDDNGETWHEDELITVNGKNSVEFEIEIEDISDADIITISGGVVYSQRWHESDAPTFEAYFKKWKKKQTMETIILNLDISKMPTVMKMLKELGVKVHRN